MLSKKEIREQIEFILKERINRESLYNEIFEAVVKALTRFEGKVFSKRMETAVIKALPESAIVSYQVKYGMFYLYVWGGDLHYESRMSIMMGYNTNPVFHVGKWDELHSGIEYFSNCYGNACKKRIASNIKLWKDSKKLSRIVTLISRMQEDKRKLYELRDECSVSLEIEKLLD